MKLHVFSIILLTVCLNGSAQSNPKMPDYLTSYFQLKDALHLGDATKAKVEAKAMKSKTGSINTNDKKKIESINASLDAIASANDISSQRTTFAKLSQQIIGILEENPVAGVTIYSDFCQMARDGKGAYWLSLEKEIKNNPYMGTQMPYCGTVDQKISK